ncbi:MAG: exodeoxyribonuclease VII small subunit [Pyrinomonadaceae bacterium]
MKKRDGSSGGKSVETSGDFESSLTALEKIVRELERGELPLEQSLELFEQGVRLSRECQTRLNQAERRIEILMRDANGDAIVGAFGDEELSLGARQTEADETDESVF